MNSISRQLKEFGIMQGLVIALVALVFLIGAIPGSEFSRAVVDTAEPHSLAEF